MFSRMRQFFYRHRRKFIVSGLLLGGTYFISRFLQRKFFEWQEKEAKEFFERTRKQHHFQSTERTCNQTIVSLAPAVKEVVYREVNTDDLVKKLREGEGDRVSTWEELKIRAFTQHLSLIYSGFALVALLRVQLNIIGGYICSKLSSDAGNGETVIDPTLQEDYLSLSEGLINEGVKNICATISKHVQEVLRDVPLKKSMTLQDIEKTFWMIEERISNDADDPIKTLSRFLAPLSRKSDFKTSDKAKLYKIISETIEVLDTEEVNSLAASCIKRGFSNSVDRIAEYFVPKNEAVSPDSPSTSDSPFTNINSVSMPMAKLIPIIYGLAREPVTRGEPESWIQQFIVMDKLVTFGANLYESFSYSV